MTVITLLLLTGLFESLPEATLAAVVIAALIELVDLPALHALYRLSSRRLGAIYGLAARADFIAAVAAMLGVMVFDTLPGLFIGISTSLLLLVYRSSRPNIAQLGRVPGDERWEDIERHPDAVTAPGIVVLRPESGLFFANADAVRQSVLAATSPEVDAVVIDAATAPFIDATAARMLDALGAQLADQGVRMVLARGVGQVRDELRASERMAAGAHEIELYSSVEEAVRRLGIAAGRGR